MKFVMYAKGSRGRAVAQALFENELYPAAIVVEKPDEAFSTLATQYHIELQECARPSAPAHIAWLKNLKPDLLLAVGYSKILPQKLLEIPASGAINCHGGQLPYYRGASPIPWQIIRGETEGAAYILVMTPGIDDGPIIASEVYPIGKDDTAKNITARVNDIFVRLVPDVIRQYSSGSLPALREQDPGQVCIWTRRYPGDGLIRWHEMTAEEIVNLVRALDEPYPGAFTYCRGKKILIKKAVVHPTLIRGVPGRFVGNRDGMPTIIAKDQSIGVISFSVDGQTGVPFPAKYGDDLHTSPEHDERGAL